MFVAASQVAVCLLFEVFDTELWGATPKQRGHGAFVLYHPFSDKSPYYRPRGTKDNLMDYSGGTFLNKYHWDLINDPRRIVRVMQDEGEGEKLKAIPIEISQFDIDISNIVSADDYISCLTPAGKVFTIPASSKLYFTGWLKDYPDVNLTNGALKAFVLPNGQTYVSHYTKQSTEEHWIFNGYRIPGESSNNYYVDNQTKNSPMNVNVLIAEEDVECRLHFKTVKAQKNKLPDKNYNGNGKMCKLSYRLIDEIAVKYYKSSCITGLAERFYNERVNSQVLSNSELLEIAKYIQDLGDILYYEYEQMAYKNISEYEKYILNMSGEDQVSYASFKKTIKNYLDYKKKLQQNISKTEPDNIIDFVEFLTVADLQNLTIKERMHLLKVFSETKLTNGWFWGNGGEKLVIDVIKYTQKPQIASLFTELNKGTITKDICSKIQNSPVGKTNYDIFMRELMILFFKQEISDIKDLAEMKEIFSWHRSNQYNVIYHVSFNEEGNIDISGELDYLTDDGTERKLLKDYHEATILEPFDIVGVNFTTKVDFIGVENAVFPMTAIHLKWIINKYRAGEIKEMINLAIDVASFCFAVGEVKAALKMADKSCKLALRLAGLIHASGELFFELDEESVNGLNNSENGRIFLTTWNTIGSLLNTGDAIESIINKKFPLFISLKFAWDKMSPEQRNLLQESERGKILKIVKAINYELNNN